MQPMQTKDITSKQLLKRMAADLANLLLKLDIDPQSSPASESPAGLAPP